MYVVFAWKLQVKSTSQSKRKVRGGKKGKLIKNLSYVCSDIGKEKSEELSPFEFQLKYK